MENNHATGYEKAKKEYTFWVSLKNLLMTQDAKRHEDFPQVLKEVTERMKQAELRMCQLF